MRWFIRAAMITAASLGIAASAQAVETIKVAAISDPGYASALWAVMNGKVSDPTVTVTVDMMPIPAVRFTKMWLLVRRAWYSGMRGFKYSMNLRHRVVHP